MNKNCLLLILLGLLSMSATADEMIMKNGSRLVGKVVSAHQGKIVFNTPFAGDIKVKAENVERVTTADAVTLKMTDGAIYKERQIVSTDQGTSVITDGEPPVFVKPGDIAYVNPEPWRLGEGYKWFGEVNTAAVLERGNTDTDEYDADFKSIWRSLVDRYTLRGMYEVDKTNGEKNKNQWRLRGKYDRFTNQDPNTYYGAQLVFFHDEFADLDLRTTVGPYIGRQFYESSLLSLSGELGLVYVDEQFDVAEDDDFVGGNWELMLTSDIIPRTELYVDQVGVLNFDDIDGVLVDTILGIKFPLLYGFQTALEAKFEYDGGAVGDVDELDQTYSFKLGYTW
ncbi:MAG: DUF481 domain-containing protein [Halieaceae bacterium]